MIKFVEDKPNNFEAGTLSFLWGCVAKDLIAKNPSLVIPDKKGKLMHTIGHICNAGPCFHYNLKPWQDTRKS